MWPTSHVWAGVGGSGCGQDNTWATVEHFINPNFSTHNFIDLAASCWLWWPHSSLPTVLSAASPGPSGQCFLPSVWCSLERKERERLDHCFRVERVGCGRPGTAQSRPGVPSPAQACPEPPRACQGDLSLGCVPSSISSNLAWSCLS